MITNFRVVCVNNITQLEPLWHTCNTNLNGHFLMTFNYEKTLCLDTNNRL